VISIVPISAIGLLIGYLLYHFSDAIVGRFFGKKEDAIKPEQLEAIGNAEADRKHDREVKDSRRAIHRTNLLAVYNKMAMSYITNSLGTGGGLSYHPLYLEIYIHEWPVENNDIYKKDARLDLQCWPPADSACSRFEKKFNDAHLESWDIITTLSASLEELFKEYGLEPASVTQEWYSEECAIKYLVLKRIVQGDKYQIDLRFVDGFIRVFENGQSITALAHGLSPEKSTELIKSLTNIPDELNRLQEDKAFFSTLSERILQLQRDFQATESALKDFKEPLKKVTKDLRDGFGPPGGGKCETCKAIEKGGI
jgi:hypothetical protein